MPKDFAVLVFRIFSFAFVVLEDNLKMYGLFHWTVAGTVSALCTMKLSSDYANDLPDTGMAWMVSVSSSRWTTNEISRYLVSYVKLRS